MAVETILASAALPIITDLLKSIGGAVSRRFVGLSVDDQIKLGNADVARLEALAKLDNPSGTPSQWVVDLRAAFRYVAAGLMIACGIALMLLGLVMDQPGQKLVALDLGFQVASAPFGFIFGERLMLSFKGGRK